VIDEHFCRDSAEERAPAAHGDDQELVQHDRCLKGNLVGITGSLRPGVGQPVPLYAAARRELETNPAEPERVLGVGGVRTRKKPAACAGRGLERIEKPGFWL
jgi:hypothetical protein